MDREGRRGAREAVARVERELLERPGLCQEEVEREEERD